MPASPRPSSPVTSYPGGAGQPVRPPASPWRLRHGSALLSIGNQSAPLVGTSAGGNGLAGSESRFEGVMARRQRSEDRGQKSEDRGQKSEVGSHKGTKKSDWRLASFECTKRALV